MRAGTLVGILLVCGPALCVAQTCTTQAKMAPALRDDLSGATMSLAQAVKADDAAKVQANTIAEFAGATSFAPTASLVHATASRLGGDQLQVAQIYELNASTRQPGDTSEADFSCPLFGTTSETDFAITGLPPGMYGFAMVEATGDHPWLLSFLLQQDEGVWKLAGFYPHSLVAAGHDGLWYWKTARTYAKADELWLAWIFYGEADQLLRPANFVSSTNLEALRSERHAAAPPELLNGIGLDNPVILKATAQQTKAMEYRLTGIAAENSEDGQRLNLVLHLAGDSSMDAAAATAQSKGAAHSFLDAHMELRQAFHHVLVFTDIAGRAPLVTEQTIADIP
ncbi:MAG: hypothetical protein WBY53_01895 [Acidobacteriaceae bacterium]